MPYAPTADQLPVITVIGTRTHYRWSVSETLASQTTEFVIAGAPETGTMTLYMAKRTAGTGTVINPRIGRSAGFALTDLGAVTSSLTAAVINDATTVRYSGLTGGKLYVRNYPDNAAADHSISTEIEIVAGHF
jgi:hypothetical protein